MGEASETVAELYQREVKRLFSSYPPDSARNDVHDEIRGRFRALADYLASTVPACPELWRSVQELHVSMMLANAAVAGTWRPITVTPPHSVWPKGMPAR